MQQRMRRRGIIVGLLSLGLLATAALTAGPAQADSPGPYYATPSWDQTLPAATRFIVLSNFAGAAVLDRETGLVWEKSPDTASINWTDARLSCPNKNVGGVGRKGWRLPSFPELASLVHSNNSDPALPTGHPFTNIGAGGHWSATTNAEDAALVWYVNFFDGSVGNNSEKTLSGYVWCVRGGMNADAY